MGILIEVGWVEVADGDGDGVEDGYRIYNCPPPTMGRLTLSSISLAVVALPSWQTIMGFSNGVI